MKYILPMQNAKVNSLTNRTNRVLARLSVIIGVYFAVLYDIRFLTS